MPDVARARPRCAAVQKLGLGTVQFGQDHVGGHMQGRMPVADAMAAVALAADAGVRMIDTSAQYGDAEAVLGQVLPLAPPAPPPFSLITKTAPLALGLAVVELTARASLQRMRVERAAGIVVHTASDLLEPEGEALWDRLKKLKDEGLFESIGISAAATDDPVGLARRFKPDLMQLPVSLLDQRLIRDGALETLAGMSVEIHFRSVFHHGLLFLPRAQLPPGLAKCGPRLSRIQRTIAEAGADPLQAALAFALDRPEASCVIIGVASAAELRAVIAAAAAPTPQLDWEALTLDAPPVFPRRLGSAA